MWPISQCPMCPYNCLSVFPSDCPLACLPVCPLIFLQVSQAESLIEERDEEIRKVVETIAELASIMRDLSTLIVEQGTMLDRIDHNVTETAMKVSAAVQLWVACVCV